MEKNDETLITFQYCPLKQHDVQCNIIQCSDMQCTPLHYMSLHCVSLHCMSLHCMSLHVMTLHFMTSACIGSGFHLQQTLYILCFCNASVTRQLPDSQYVSKVKGSYGNIDKYFNFTISKRYNNQNIFYSDR